MTVNMVDSAQSTASHSVKSAERTARLLEILSSSPESLGLSDLQNITGYPRSSVHALIRTLRDLGWVEADASTTRFRVGVRALVCGTAFLDRDEAVPYARRALEEIRAELGHTVHFARRDNDEVIYLESRESLISSRSIFRVGRALPAHSTALGQCLLAELTDEEVDTILSDDLPALTSKTITTRRQLEEELEQVRKRGWAYEREQGTEGVACIAAVVAYRIPSTDAVSCSFPIDTPPEEVDRIAKVVTESCEKLANTLRREGIR